jgi:hypothetical protein
MGKFCGFFQKFHNRYPLATLFYLGGKESGFSPKINFPQYKGNILSIIQIREIFPQL